MPVTLSCTNYKLASNCVRKVILLLNKYGRVKKIKQITNLVHIICQFGKKEEMFVILLEYACTAWTIEHVSTYTVKISQFREDFSCAQT